MTLRSAAHWFHRYTGLVMAFFLILTSLTGVLLTFHESLDDWFNRDYLTVQHIPSQVSNNEQLPITELHRSLQMQYPQAKFSTLPLAQIPEDRAVSFRVDRQRGEAKSAASVDFQTVYMNPYTAEIIGTRNHDEWAWRNTMNKIFWFHRELLLGTVGRWILGIVALLWTINCFIGVYLTLPRTVKPKKKSGSKATRRKRSNYWKRWLPAWTIRRTKNTFKLSFDAHHALSLWLWAMMFVLAWSSVGFNLNAVYKPVMAAVFPDATEQDSKQDRPSKKERLQEGKDNADSKANKRYALNVTMTQIDKAKQTALNYADSKGVTVESFSSFNVDRQSGAQTIRFKTNLDTVGRGSSVTINTSTANPSTADVKAVNSQVVDTHTYQQPLDTKAEVKWGFERSTRDSVSMWLVYLHRGFVWGTPYKIFLAFVGLATAIVSGTGVYLWWRGRQARLKKQARLNSKVGQA